MFSVKGLFDGKKIKLLEKVAVNKPQKVIVTFLDSNRDETLHHEIYKLANTGGSFFS